MSLLRPLPFGLLAAAALATPARAGDKLDKDQKKWLESVWAIMLPEEEKVYKDLKKDDRAEFQKIFWARRDPDLATQENEFQAQYQSNAAEADKRYKVGGRAGSATDCGRVFLLLGEPNQVEKDEEGELSGPRAAEVWTFKDRPGMTFKGGQVQIAFDGECQLPQGARLGEQLNQVAESRIAHPNIGFRLEGGRLVKLADLRPKPSPVQTLLKEPRQEFPLQAQPKLYMRGSGGATYVALLARGEAAGLALAEVDGRKQAAVTVAANAVDESGKSAANSPAQDMTTEVGADGSFAVSSGLVLRPGKYVINTAVLQDATQKGSVVPLTIEVPDFGGKELTATNIVMALDIREQASRDDKNPLSAFLLGSTQIVPRFGNVFTRQDSLQMLTLVYGLGTRSSGPISMSKFLSAAPGMTYSAVRELFGRDGEETARSAAGGVSTVIYEWKNEDGSNMSATFQDGVLSTRAQAGLGDVTAETASATAQFTILKDGRVRSSSQEQYYDTPEAAPGVGPLPLEKFEPGAYVVRLRVVDKVAQKEITKEAEFEVKP